MGALDDEGPVNVWYTWKVSPLVVKIAAVVVSVCLFLFLEAAPEWVSKAPNPHMHLGSNDKLNSGAVVYEEIGGAEVVWLSPPNPKAILFVAHGCNHQATDFWHPSETCPKCTGLPEEVRIARTAYDRGYAVVAISSQDRLSRCWHRQTDGPIVQLVFDILRARQGWLKQPLMALGASSGGSFVGYLPKILKVDALTVQIMGLRSGDFYPPFADGRRNFPPTIFIHMPRDERTQQVVLDNVKELRTRFVPAAAVQQLPLKINPMFFAERIDRVSAEASVDAVTKLVSNKYLDSSAFLLHDPRHSDWRTVLQGTEVARGDSLGPDESAVAEVLNLAWAAHEIVSDWSIETMDFFDSVAPTNEKDRTKAIVSELNKRHRHAMHPLAMALVGGRGNVSDVTDAIDKMKRNDDSFHLIVEVPPAPLCEDC
eukprot:CAMPEP_0118953172 /NCGR_PEP_ID=MMETSP1169-20130426/56086_1 /TAXON_ID=36882 /ORGANISM="Pyramimonas obovata, Strain CCMP722" /LENGTH=425 /DNA_ID=CAMNT_0006900565 /DNA_START=104 /DNA_END=1381 /DNA_ORIENTATION=-